MSYTEDIFEKSLKLILKSSTIFYRNYRPTWLINPDTGCSLELDFYIPVLKLGFEIQGQHHYDDAKQQTRDTQKMLLCKERGVTIILCSIFQMNVGFIYRKIVNFCKANTLPCVVKRFDRDWWKNTNSEIRQYKSLIAHQYGRQTCTYSPTSVQTKQQCQVLRDKVSFLNTIDVVLNGKLTRVQLLHDKLQRGKIRYRICGSNQIRSVTIAKFKQITTGVKGFDRV